MAAKKEYRGHMKSKYRCSACNWRFTRTVMPKMCPYCGKEKVEEDKTQAADELLRELE